MVRKLRIINSLLAALVCLVLVLLPRLAAQNNSTAPPAYKRPQPAYLVAQAAPSPKSQESLQSLLSSADSVLQEMSRITGLPIKAPLKKKIVTRDQIHRYLTESLHAEYSPREIHQQEVVLKAFGLVSREFNLGEFLVKFYTEQAAGMYDQRSKTMLIADWIAPEMQQMVLSHELTHALQDQNFDLEKFLREVRSDDDAGNARQALVEGYATAAMIQKMIEPASLAELPTLAPFMNQAVQMQTQEFPAFSSAPFFFRFQALFPYTEGLGFVQQGLSIGGWPRLNQVFSRPPNRTNEIFHPSIYFQQQALPSVILARSTPLSAEPDLQLVDENSMGELGYYALLGQFISEAEARSVAQGWQGDRYIVYENARASRYALVASTRWGSPENSLAFFRDYHTILARKYPELTPDPRTKEEMFVGSTSSGKVILLRDADECLWAEGVPEAQVDRMMTYLRSQVNTQVVAAPSARYGWRVSPGQNLIANFTQH